MAASEITFLLFILNLLVTYTLQNPICENRIYVYAKN